MSKLVNMIDADHDLVIFVKLEDVLEAHTKDARVCDASGKRKWGCAIENAMLRQHQEFYGVCVHGTVARAMLRDTSKPILRWILERDGKKIVNLNDLSLEEMKRLNWPVEIRLVSPVAFVPDEELRRKRFTRSLAWGRSEEGKQAKRESAGRREGMEPRPYIASSNVGRSGRGMGDSWMMREESEDN